MGTFTFLRLVLFLTCTKITMCIWTQINSKPLLRFQFFITIVSLNFRLFCLLCTSYLYQRFCVIHYFCCLHMNSTYRSIDLDFLLEYSKRKFHIYEQPRFKNNHNYYYYYCYHRYCYYYCCYYCINNIHEKIIQFWLVKINEVFK